MVIYREFLPIHEEINNIIIAKTINAIVLGFNSNLQGSIRCFTLVTSKVLY